MSKRKKPIPPKVYKGTMIFPLCGAETQQEFHSVCRFTGDFINPVKRHQIFKRPRYYVVEIHLNVNGTDEYEIDELNILNNKLDKYELSQIMHQYAVSGVKDLSERTDVDVNRSFFKVIL